MELKVIWLSGGGALAQASTEVLLQMLGKSVAVWDNTKKVEISKDVDGKFLESRSSELNVAFGMALREL